MSSLSHRLGVFKVGLEGRIRRAENQKKSLRHRTMITMMLWRSNETKRHEPFFCARVPFPSKNRWAFLVIGTLGFVKHQKGSFSGTGVCRAFWKYDAGEGSIRDVVTGQLNVSDI